METQTRQLFDNYLQRVAQLNGIPLTTVASGKNFTIAAEIAQRIREAIKESSDFLRQINLMGVDNQKGEALGLGATGTIARTNKTTGQGAAARTPADPTGFDQNPYECTQTNFDTALRYDKLDAWRHLPNFPSLWNRAVTVQIALDMIRIGWYGETRADASDPVTNPNLEDVNVGWLEKIRTNNSSRWLTDGDYTPGQQKEIRVGIRDPEVKDWDYRSLDALAMDLKKLLHLRFQEDPSVICIISADLCNDKYLTLLQSSSDIPTEMNAMQVIMLNKRVGPFMAMVAPFFPPGTMLLTPLSNLSIYTQNGTMRRTIDEEPEWDRVADYMSYNMAYVVEYYEAVAGAENIIAPEQGTWVSDETETPVAAFSATPLTGAAPLSVTFTDASTNVPTQWLWEFGDGATSTSQNPVHSYATAGQKSVRLTASNSAGIDVEVKTNYITVSSP